MAIEEKRSIEEPIYIRNHDEYKFVCRYFINSGKTEEKLREEIGTVTFNKGYYVKNKGDIIGIFSSKNGPVIFKNNEQYLIEPGKTKMELSESMNGTSVFRLIINGLEVLTVTYEKSKFVNFDVWSDDEMVDFYLWLTNQQNEQKFYNFYTDR